MKTRFVDYYFSAGLRWTLALGSAVLIIYNLVNNKTGFFDLILVVANLIAFSTKYDLTVDNDKKEINDSFKFLWISVKKDLVNFQTLNRIIVRKEKNAYMANSRSRSRQVSYNEYIGSLEYDNGKTIELSRSIDYDSFTAEMKSVAGKLKLEIVSDN
ncbi:hypothetical protein JMN32_10140 [Fulvivirga sp. 29W222]|uniref:Uncharacterized protein n=1 Tax=Fulvivirga marina TaxID=2494733 RepID=A0A937KBT0_9BACT|nr:hypothetical protein [Fulvivirga marina]MBL6446672.1 hypothetical protein [Fulvivirga marina]